MAVRDQIQKSGTRRDVKLYRATKSLSAVIHIPTHTHQLIHFYISICFFFKNNLTRQMVCYMEPSGNCFQGLWIKLGRWLDKPTSTNQRDSRRAAPSLELVHKIQSLQCRSLLFFRWNKFSSADRTDATAAATLTSGGAAEQSNTWTTPVAASSSSKTLIGAKLEVWRDGFAWSQVSSCVLS